MWHEGQGIKDDAGNTDAQQQQYDAPNVDMPVAICGDNTINGTEQCDGTQLGGKSCVTQGFYDGTLSCNSNCTFDISDCTTQGFIAINAGIFNMGSPTSENCRDSDETQHQVTLTHNFEISAYETTQSEFQISMGYNPSYFSSCGNDCPVEQVNWHEAVAYCNALSDKKGLTKCYSCAESGTSVTCTESSAYSGANIYNCPGYRLPTEAEWEYTYRAGTTTAFYNGGFVSCTHNYKANDIGWYFYNANSTTHPKGQKQANEWGLYDMAGNVWEWCHDWYGGYGSSAVTDPLSSSSGSERVLRGGSWRFNASSMRAAKRNSDPPMERYDNLGFRLNVQTLPLL